MKHEANSPTSGRLEPMKKLREEIVCQMQDVQVLKNVVPSAHDAKAEATT
jgi:hypothetical protein